MNSVKTKHASHNLFSHPKLCIEVSHLNEILVFQLCRVTWDCSQSLWNPSLMNCSLCREAHSALSHFLQSRSSLTSEYYWDGEMCCDCLETFPDFYSVSVAKLTPTLTGLGKSSCAYIGFWFFWPCTDALLIPDSPEASMIVPEIRVSKGCGFQVLSRNWVWQAEDACSFLAAWELMLPGTVK